MELIICLFRFQERMKMINFYVGLERFQTDGISAMTHNDEKDRYRNNSLVVNYGHQFSDKIKFEGNIRIAETYNQYDKEVDTATATHSEEVDAVQSSSNIALVYKPNQQFTNKFTLDKNIYQKEFMLRLHLAVIPPKIIMLVIDML